MRNKDNGRRTITTSYTPQQQLPAIPQPVPILVKTRHRAPSLANIQRTLNELEVACAQQILNALDTGNGDTKQFRYDAFRALRHVLTNDEEK